LNGLLLQAECTWCISNQTEVMKKCYSCNKDVSLYCIITAECCSNTLIMELSLKNEHR